MKTAIAWFARNGVAANLLMILVLVGGLVTLPTIRQEVFPEIDSDMVTVTVEYLGAAPADIEESICARVEESIQGLSGIERVRSTSREGLGTVIVEIETDADTRRVIEDIKSRVEAIDSFPEEAERPLVQEMVIRKQVVNVAVSGNTSEADLRRVADRVRDEISQIPGISLVLLGNARPYEISIEVSEESLRRHEITFDRVVEAIRRSSLDLPGGSVKTRGGEVLIRTKGQAYRGPEFDRIPLLTRPDGTRLLVGDVARVVDGFAETDQLSRFDGDPALLIQVFRVGDQGAIDIADAVAGYVADARLRVPEGIRLTTWQDDSKVLRSRIDLMVRNGRMGLVFVFLCLAIFLRLRLAFWVAFGIPVSFLGAVWLLPPMDLSINLISLFAFIVVLGIVVDDAIVVGENIFTRLERGERGLDAVIVGAQEVGVPVTFAVLTTIAAFSPLLGVPGRYGEIMKVVPAVVIATLVFSLLESLFVLPHHLASIARAGPPKEPRGLVRAWGRFQGFVADLLDRFVGGVYRPALLRFVEWRYVTLAIGFSVLIVTLSLIPGGRLKFVFFPPVDADNVVGYLVMPQGTPVDATLDAALRMERAATELREELRRETGRDLFRHVLTSVGSQPFREDQNRNQGQSVTFSGAHLAELNIELMPSEEREFASSEISRRLREKVGAIPDAEELVYSSSIFASGADIAVQLASSDHESLLSAAHDLESRLQEFRGVVDVADSFRIGKRELEIDIRPEAESLGLTRAALARQVRQGFYGEEAQRIQRGRDDVRVMVRYPESERRSRSDIESMRIRTPSGGEVPFAAAATASAGRGYSIIERDNRRRVINVTAGVELAEANPGEINAVIQKEIIPEFRRLYPDVDVSFEGDQRDRTETMESLVTGFFQALALIYALLGIPFRSYLQPLIVMLAIPFGVMGAILGHLMIGIDLTFLSMFGIVALTGVVVNDSLVMVDFINRHRRAADMSVTDAILASGATRFRPILLTSLTTFAGLIPLLLERSLQAKFLVPMAVSLGFGVMFATLVTLVIVPVAYFVLDDAKNAVHWLLSRESSET